MEVGSSAYVSSVIAWMKSPSFKQYVEYFGNPDQEANDKMLVASNILCWRYFFIHLKKFKIDPDPVQSLKQLRNQNLKFGESLQSFLNIGDFDGFEGT